MATAEPITLNLFGSDEARTAYGQFTARHKRLPILRSKMFGVALLPIPANQEPPFRGVELRNFRQRHQRAITRGYSFRDIEARAHLERILAIHRSVESRQGRLLSPAYTDTERVRRYCASGRSFYGVFDSADILRAYCHVPVLGDVFSFARILGDHDRLKDGIMYLLVWEAILSMRSRKNVCGHPSWAMYDTYIGGRRGLRVFKRECGFRPYRVIWHWGKGAS